MRSITLLFLENLIQAPYALLLLLRRIMRKFMWLAHPDIIKALRFLRVHQREHRLGPQEYRW